MQKLTKHILKTTFQFRNVLGCKLEKYLEEILNKLIWSLQSSLGFCIFVPVRNTILSKMDL